jgi:hypothetical protein
MIYINFGLREELLRNTSREKEGKKVRERKKEGKNVLCSTYMICKAQPILFG